MLDYTALPSVTENKFIKDPDTYLERVDKGESPYLITSSDGSKLLLFGWEDYWSRFGALYSDGERERIKEACRHVKQDE